MDLGDFVRRYASPPEPAGPLSRSTVREDAVVRAVARMLTERAPARVRVMDACCGVGTLARGVMRSLDGDARRVSYLAIDRETGCIDRIRAELDSYAGFAEFEALQRNITDLADQGNGSVDLILLSNALHEIAPREYATVFAAFGRLLRPVNGRLAIIDMEELPELEPEAGAITWKGSEVREILRAGGFSPELTLHPKLTTVYQIHTRAVAGLVNEQAIRTKVGAMLLARLPQLAAARRQVETGLRSAAADYQRWVVLTGTIARYAEEIVSLGLFSPRQEIAEADSRAHHYHDGSEGR